MLNGSLITQVYPMKGEDCQSPIDLSTTLLAPLTLATEPFMINRGLKWQRRFDTPSGNPVKKILLQLNLSDHMSILTDSKEYLKMVMECSSNHLSLSKTLSESIHTCVKIILHFGALCYPTNDSEDLDAPSTSTSQTNQETPSLVIPLGVKEADHDIEVAHMDNNPFVEFPFPEPSSEESSTQELVPRPDCEMVITFKWIYKMKLDELGGVLKNNAHLVARDPGNPNPVYKLKKALYGLKQAPRAWYHLLSSFVLSLKFTKGTVDPTLFVRHEGKDILLVQIYVDDIIFASTKPDLCETPRDIFLNQSKYALESIKKYGIETCEPVDTPMVEK
ncbi:retrovirus-related pol polyprotein from transposon TNT 1-94 [Tanacetum coccineum]